jgi:uncharacterized protein (DUF697 family)/GTP-binding protein EngB required for normal cell division
MSLLVTSSVNKFISVPFRVRWIYRQLIANFGKNMTIKIQKPILIAGVSISFLLWFWQTIQASFAEIEVYSLWALIGLAVVFWGWKPQRNPSPPQPKIYKPITKIVLEKAFAECEKLLNQLVQEGGIIADFSRELDHLKISLSPTSLDLANRKWRCAIAGRKKAGKSSLKKILESDHNFSNLTFLEIESFANELEKENQEGAINQLCLESDLLLFVINGDLTDSEWQVIQKISCYNQRLLLVFNQKDRYPEEEQIILLKQLQERVKFSLDREDIITIATSPSQIKVKKHQGEGIFQEWMEKPQAELNSLLNRLENIFEKEKLSLIFSTTYRQAIALKNKVKQRLNQGRKERSLPKIEQYQLIAAATAFANPVSSLDLLATAAINTQMLVDLSSIYQQKLSMERAKIASITIGKLMVKLGIVEFSTQTLGSILKSNVVTYVAGGALQAISAAYLTRIAGLSLIEYFQVQETSTGETFNLDQLKQKIQVIFQENKKHIFLQNFVKTISANL